MTKISIKVMLVFFIQKVDDMLREEIMDYAMISGDDADELVIQTFINFNYQKFTAMRLVTILCDTMSCFLGLGNTTSLTECQLLVGN